MTKPFYEKGPPHDAGPRPFLVGITGGRGSGKSELGKALRIMGFRVINTDELTHEILRTPDLDAFRKVVERFGADLVKENGHIDRDLLRERAFATPTSRAELQAIMHPAIAELLERYVRQLADEDVVFVEVPLLLESNWDDRFDLIWCVVADDAVRIPRVQERDGCDEAEALRLINQHGLSQEEKAKRSHYVFDNSTTKEALQEQLEQQVAELRVILARKASSSEPAETPSEPSTPDGGASNEHIHDSLKRASLMGTESALDRMGELSKTGHKEASARVRLTVDSCDGEHTGDDHTHTGRELEVTVHMSVRNKKDRPDTDGCSCGCGDTCRVSCACRPDCGCKCKKPEPCPDGECSHGTHRHPNRLYALLGLFGLLAFLFAVLVFWYWNRPAKDDKPPQITIVNKVPCPPTDPTTPTPTNPAPFTPPTPPEAPPETKPVRKAVLDEAPGYAFRFLHNAVRVKVAKWDEKEDENGIVLKGYDADNRLLVYQVYDAHHWMTHQWVVNYHPEGSVYVDRFEGRLNRFVGRTIYTYNQYGGLERVRFEQSDGVKRIDGSLKRNASGAVTAVYVINYDPQGRETGRNVIEGLDSVNTYIDGNFYLTRWFAGT